LICDERVASVPSLFNLIEASFPAMPGFQPDEDMWIYVYRLPEPFLPDVVSGGRQEIEFRAKAGTERRENISTLCVDFRLSARNCLYFTANIGPVIDELNGNVRRLSYFRYKLWPDVEVPFWLRQAASGSRYMAWGIELDSGRMDIEALREEIEFQGDDRFYSGTLEVSFIEIDLSKIPEKIVEKPVEVTAEKKSVLLVDDNETTLNLLQLILETEFDQSEIAFIPCSSGHKAFEMALSMLPSLVLLDVMMPDKDGLEVLAELKKNPQTKDIPIVMVSAKADEDTIARAEEIGAVQYLVKPFVPFDITRVIRELLFGED
jgi:CheY-like chemotaxis protein